MKNNFRLMPILIGLCLSFFISLTACNDKKQQTTSVSETSSAIHFENLHVVLPPPVASATSVYGDITNTGKAADILMSISSNAGMVMLHQSLIKEGIAQMVHLDNYEIKPNEALVLKPMSYHIMLMNIDHDIVKEGGMVKLSFHFKKAGLVEQLVPVLAE